MTISVAPIRTLGVSYEAKALVDTFVLVLAPESGDTIQAVKAGILEVADEAHRNAVLDADRKQELARSRVHYHVRSLLLHRIDEILSGNRDLSNVASGEGVLILERLLYQAEISE